MHAGTRCVAPRHPEQVVEHPHGGANGEEGPSESCRGRGRWPSDLGAVEAQKPQKTAEE